MLSYRRIVGGGYLRKKVGLSSSPPPPCSLAFTPNRTPPHKIQYELELCLQRALLSTVSSAFPESAIIAVRRRDRKRQACQVLPAVLRPTTLARRRGKLPLVLPSSRRALSRFLVLSCFRSSLASDRLGLHRHRNCRGHRHRRIRYTPTACFLSEVEGLSHTQKCLSS